MRDQAYELRRMVAREAPAASSRSRTIEITSGKGGVGKSNIALNLGLALSEAGVSTLLVDADWGLANTDVLLGETPERHLGDVLNGSCRLEEILREGPLGLRWAPGAVADRTSSDADRRRELFRELARSGGRAEIVLFDTAAGLSEETLDLALFADLVLVVVTPEPTALTDAYAAVKALSRGGDAPSMGLVVNCAASATEAAGVARGFADVTARFLGIAIPMLGYLPNDWRVAAAVRRRSPFFLDHPRSALAGCVRSLANRLLKADSGVAPAPPARDRTYDAASPGGRHASSY